MRMKYGPGTWQHRANNRNNWRAGRPTSSNHRRVCRCLCLSSFGIIRMLRPVVRGDGQCGLCRGTWVCYQTIPVITTDGIILHKIIQIDPPVLLNRIAICPSADLGVVKGRSGKISKQRKQKNKAENDSIKCCFHGVYFLQIGTLAPPLSIRRSYFQDALPNLIRHFLTPNPSEQMLKLRTMLRLVRHSINESCTVPRKQRFQRPSRE
jgi:hypothetical protein